jgi:hypothetical protein
MAFLIAFLLCEWWMGPVPVPRVVESELTRQVGRIALG